jgi:hypothetical protein
MASTALVPAGANAAERLYGVTGRDQLVTFHSDSPGVFRSRKPITGLRGGDSDRITAIDVRPSTGGLYGLSANSRLYKIEVRTGRAMPVGGPLSPRLGPLDVGFDFNPAADKLRVVTEPGLNFRVDPATGRLVDGAPALGGPQGDRNLSYEANDPAGSAEPVVTSSAYTDNPAGAVRTQLFGIDTARDTLVLQDPPNEGVLNTVGRLRINAGGPVGFDIASDGRAYASFAQRGRGPTGLFRIRLSNGRATPAADFNAVGVFARTDDDEVRALAAAGRVADDKSPPRVGNRKLNDPRVSQLLVGRVLRLAVRCSEACAVESQLVLGRRVVGDDTGAVLARGGRTVLKLRLSRKGRRIVRRLRPNRLDVAIAATDAAGNALRTSRFQR